MLELDDISKRLGPAAGEIDSGENLDGVVAADVGCGDEVGVVVVPVDGGVGTVSRSSEGFGAVGVVATDFGDGRGWEVLRTVGGAGLIVGSGLDSGPLLVLDF